MGTKRTGTDGSRYRTVTISTPRHRHLLMLGLIMWSGIQSEAATPDTPTVTQAEATVPDFSGFWIRKSAPRVAGSAPPDLPEGWRTLSAFPPPLRPEAYEVVRAQRVKEAAAMDNKDGTDPQTARCAPAGMPDVMLHTSPLDILQRRDEIVMMTERERTYPRHIYILPFHPLAEEYDPKVSGNLTPNGRSLARWEGRTLVIHTNGLDPEPYMASIDRVPHSDEMTINERLSLDANGNVLTAEMEVHDPKTLLRPWTFTLTYARAPPETEAIQQVCSPESL